MEEIILNMLKDPQTISFGVLFLGLLWYVLSTTGNREKRYLETIENLTKALGDLDVIKTTVSKISDKLGGNE